jgi:hypothetical protein
MALGLSFGKKTNKTNSTTTVDKTESTAQQQTSDKASTQTTQSAATQQAASATQGQQATQQSGASQTSGTQTGTTTQTTSAFGSNILGGIEQAVNSLFERTSTPLSSSNFDARSFIDEGVQAAASDINSGLEGDINTLVTGLGGSTGNNSMSALLANRLRGDAASKLAGIKSGLTGQAEEILRNNAVASSQVASVDQNFLGNLLSALKGGQVTTTGTESVATTQNQQTQSIGSAQTSEQSQSQQASQQIQTQQLLEQLTQLLSGTTTTTGTENTKGTTKQSGGGFSLGL